MQVTRENEATKRGDYANQLGFTTNQPSNNAFARLYSTSST